MSLILEIDRETYKIIVFYPFSVLNSSKTHPRTTKRIPIAAKNDMPIILQIKKGIQNNYIQNLKCLY